MTERPQRKKVVAPVESIREPSSGYGGEEMQR